MIAEPKNSGCANKESCNVRVQIIFRGLKYFVFVQARPMFELY